MGKHLVILPGWGGSHKTWADFVSRIATKVDGVQVIDLPCVGDEPCPTDVWGVEEYAAFVRNKLAGRSDIVLLGHSFGGQVAAYLAATTPDICTTLVLSGAAVIRPSRTIKRSIFGVLAKCGKLLFALPGLSRFEQKAKKLLYRAADSPDYSNTDAIQKDIFKKVIRQDIQHMLPQIQAETHIVWGDHDTYTPLKHGRRIARTMPRATLHIIKGGTHGLHVSKPDELLSVLTPLV